jgi:TRAF3-interacting protein 1
MKQKLLSRPPFRFIADTVLNISKATGFLDGLYSGEMETTPKIIKDKADKLAWLTKLVNAVGLFWGQALTVKASKVVAGLEADQTNMLLQAIALGASSGQNSSGAVEAALNGNVPSATSSSSSSAERGSSSKEDAGSSSSSRASPPKQREEARPSRNRDTQESKAAEPAAQQERPRRSARPSTARRRPPKLKENVTESKTKGASAKPVRGIMTEGAGDDDDEDDESEEETAMPGSLGSGLGGAMNTLGGDPVDKAQAGKLVRDIMDDEAAMRKKDGRAENIKETKLGDGGIRMGKIGRSRKGGKKGRRGRGESDDRQGGSKTSSGKGLEMSNEELEELRQAIQAISQSTHPLSKCMDFVHDDVALMNEEAEEWNKMYRDKIGSMEAASKDTDEALQALVERREEIRDQIAAEKLKINSVKASIAMNDARINELLQMVVHTSR